MSARRETELPDLIRLVYQAAADAKLWPVLLDRLTDALGAEACAASVYDPATQFYSYVAPRTDPEWQQKYLDRWVHSNFLWQRSIHKPVGELWCFDTFIPRDEFERTEFYNEWWRPQGMEVALGTNVLREGSASGVVTFYRSRERGEFGSDAMRTFAALVPHLQQAVQLQLHLTETGIQRDGSVEMLNRLEQGALLVDRDARILFANAAADAMLNDGAALCAKDGRLRTRRPAETEALHRLIFACESATGSGGLLGVAREGRWPLSLLVTPLKAELSWLVRERPAAIVFIKDPEQVTKPSAEHLRQLFGLTHAEAVVALEMLEGDGLSAAAERLQLSLATVRTHRLRVFEKTGTSRQAELVRLLLNMLPPVRQGRPTV